MLWIYLAGIWLFDWIYAEEGLFLDSTLAYDGMVNGDENKELIEEIEDGDWRLYTVARSIPNPWIQYGGRFRIWTYNWKSAGTAGAHNVGTRCLS